MHGLHVISIVEDILGMILRRAWNSMLKTIAIDSPDQHFQIELSVRIDTSMIYVCTIQHCGHWPHMPV